MVENNYKDICLKIEKTIEAFADKIIVEKDYIKGTYFLIKNSCHKNIGNEIFRYGFNFLTKTLEEKEKYQNDYDVILNWHEKPKVEYIFYGYFFIIGFSLEFKKKDSLKIKNEN